VGFIVFFKWALKKTRAFFLGQVFFATTLLRSEKSRDQSTEARNANLELIIAFTAIFAFSLSFCISLPETVSCFSVARCFRTSDVQDGNRWTRCMGQAVQSIRGSEIETQLCGSDRCLVH